MERCARALLLRSSTVAICRNVGAVRALHATVASANKIRDRVIPDADLSLEVKRNLILETRSLDITWLDRLISGYSYLERGL